MLLSIFLITGALAAEVLAPIHVSEPRTELADFTVTPLWEVREEELQHAQQLADALEHIPGITSTQSGGPGARSAFYLRGSESRHALVLLDGFRLNDPAGTDRGFDGAFFRPEALQEIVYLPGPSPALYGADAISGVIELVPRRGGDSPRRSLSTRVGSFDTRALSGVVDWGAGGQRGSVTAQHFATRGFSRLNKRRHGASEADGSEMHQVSQASTHQWTPKAATELTLLANRGRIEQDGASADEPSDHSKNDLLGIIQRTTWTTGEDQLWLKTGIVSQVRRPVTASQGSEKYQAQERRLQLAYARPRSEGTSFVAGVELSQEWLSISDVTAQTDLAALFAQQRYSRGRWTFSVGGRGERHQRYGNFFAPEAGVSFDAWAGQLFSKVARGYKAPSLYQLYAPPSFGSDIGNPALTPEINESFEVGFRSRGPRVLHLTLFEQNFSNLISYTNTGYQNRGELVVRGLELGVAWELSGRDVLALTGTLLEFSQFERTPLRRPSHQGLARWGHEAGRFKSDLELRIVGERRDIDTAGEVRRLTPYELVNLRLSWELSRQDHVAVELQNLTDRDYEELWGYSVAPRSGYVSWQHRW